MDLLLIYYLVGPFLNRFSILELQVFDDATVSSDRNFQKWLKKWLGDDSFKQLIYVYESEDTCNYVNSLTTYNRHIVLPNPGIPVIYIAYCDP